jgi:hypothetical protein
VDRFARQHRHRIAPRQPDVEVMFDNLPNSIEYIKARRMRLLAATSATLSENVPGYVAGLVVGRWRAQAPFRAYMQRV